MEPMRPTSRTDLVVEAIKRAILNGDLRPGQPLVERDIAEQLGISKTPVREALKVLSHSGLVATSTYRPMHVVEVDIAFVASVNEVRLLLEPAAVGHATAHHTSETIDGLHVHLQESLDANAAADLTRLSLSNRQFHRALYAPHPNGMLTSILDGLHDKAALLSVVGWQRDLTWPTEQREHEEIVSAVEQGDGDQAGALLKAHIRRFADRLLVRLAAAPPDTTPERPDDPDEHGSPDE